MLRKVLDTSMTYAKQRTRESRKNKADRKDPVGFLHQDNLINLPYKNSKIQTTKFIKPITRNQKRFVDSIKQNHFTFGIGAAGCGKSLLALHSAICALNTEEEQIEKIIYVRANVGCKDEMEVGALPGELESKVTPLAYPIYDSCREFMNEVAVKALFEFEKIEVLPVSFLRGRSFAKTFVIVDEAQNLTKAGFTTVLTRRSHNSKMVLVGDPQQSDISSNTNIFQRIGITLSELDGIGLVEFGQEDIVRDELIFPILERLKNIY